MSNGAPSSPVPTWGHSDLKLEANPAATGSAALFLPPSRAGAVSLSMQTVGQADPALLLLKGDVGLARFPLGIQATELLRHSFLGRLARGDSAADQGWQKNSLTGYPE